ncbi:MAG: type II and III secretion system family protein [Rhodospirillales bacterium]|nr:type II and III secretion system family protein [Alphaproteobacteria bacterium]MCB9986879.1 type II and III secretion system family protein [Rhodospirillales bacterium]USO08343.1 MAG: type II and III secretion system family protein [Rhodospirillales bacterium]
MGKGTGINAQTHLLRTALMAAAAACGLVLASCAPMQAPDPRGVSIPAPTPPEERRHALNETPDGVMIVPLGKDVLVPAMDEGDPLPSKEVGPFELRSENLAGALQLILSDYDIPLAFESDKGMKTGITVSNLKGPLDKVVDKVCSLANMYCLYDDGVLTVKENQTFTVSLPPLPADTTYDSIVTGLKAFTGAEGTVDTTTRTMIYTATERTAKKAEQYFERLRKSTAMIVYETYIWEVGLDGGNSAGIRWSQLGEKLGAYNIGFSLDQNTTLSDLGTPISIGLPTRGVLNLATGDVLRFISTQGSVKTISQPQLTVLSGSEAELRVAETEAYVASLTRTENTTNNSETVSTTTGQVDTGFTLKIGSSWDNGTVYGDIDIDLQQLLEFQDFPAGTGTLRLPKTAERQLKTQVRVRPGDSVLIAGLVRERQQYDKSGLGMNKPILPFSRTGTTSNTELVFLLRPRVIVYQPIEEIEKDAKERALLTLANAPLPNAVQYEGPDGVPSSVLARKVVVPKPYNPDPSIKDDGTVAIDNKGKALDTGAKPVIAPVSPEPVVVGKAPKPSGQASDLPMGTLPSNMLDPSLGGTP